MTAFSIGALQNIRTMLNEGRPMASICRVLEGIYTRDQIVEAIDALKRFPSVHDAQRRVNLVCTYQANGVPLINGRPAEDVVRQRPVAMF